MSRRVQWCPECKQQCYQEDGGRVENENIYTKLLAKAGQPTGGMERYLFLHNIFASSFPDLPHMGGYLRYRKCTNCATTWQSAEVPDDFFEVIATEVEKLQKERNALQLESEALREKLHQLKALTASMHKVIEEPAPPR